MVASASVTGEDDWNLPPHGSIKINYEVIATIVRLAALEVPGVLAIGGGGWIQELSGIFSNKESSGIQVQELEDGSYHLIVRLVLAYGVNFRQTAHQVIQKVSQQLQVMTGKRVERIDIMIDGVRHAADKPAMTDDLLGTSYPPDLP